MLRERRVVAGPLCVARVRRGRQERRLGRRAARALLLELLSERLRVLDLAPALLDGRRLALDMLVMSFLPSHLCAELPSY